MKELILSLLLQMAPPGRTAFSVELAPECADCRVASFYGGPVRQESAETGTARYRDISAALVDVAAELDPKGWQPGELVALTAAIAIVESGLREDVQVGRGWAKLADDAGGRGRGPGLEGCLAQIHPVIAWRFADSSEELRGRAERGDKAARELIVQSLLGRDHDSLRRCFRTAMRMLIQARRYCAWKAPQTPWDWASVAMYGTGNSCTSSNYGKTLARRSVYRRMVASLRGRRT